LKVFFRALLYAHSQFLCNLARFDLANQGVRQPVQPHTLYARLLGIKKTSAQPYFAVVICFDAVPSPRVVGAFWGLAPKQSSKPPKIEA